jgi:hypothetical protein
MAIDKEKLVAGIVGGIVAGFSIGVGFMIAQKSMGRFFNKKVEESDTKVADAVAKGVSDGVKQAKIEEDAASFAAMNAINSSSKSGNSRGGRAINQMNFTKQRGSYMGFDGHPSSMGFDANPLGFKSPNSELNNF